MKMIRLWRIIFIYDFERWNRTGQKQSIGVLFSPYLFYAIGNMELTPIQQAILKTISHFDVMNYPLTLIELLGRLTIKTDLMTLKTELDKLVNLKIITVEAGFYFLSGREKILQVRHHNYRLFLKKIRIAESYVYWLSMFPWIKAIAIYGSLSYKYSRNGSDIDLFFITSAGRVWSARFLINSILKLFKLRPIPGKENNANKLCVSYWIDETSLDLSISNYENDYNCYYSINNFIFLFGNSEIITNFFSINNWLKYQLPNWQPIIFINQKENNSFFKKIMELILGLLPEKYYKKIQEILLPKYYHLLNDGKRVILDDHTIKLHQGNKRQESNRLFQENYATTLAKLKNSNA